MEFDIVKTNIEGLLVIKPRIYGDERGYFYETFNERDFCEKGLSFHFVQDNESFSKKGVLRGLHFQKEHPQTKLVRVLDGHIFDVAVDLRKGSKTFGKWFGIHLTSENKMQLLIPKGFAHGFLVLSDTVTFAYKCDEYYFPNDEDGIIYNDEQLDIIWPMVDNIILSEKDKKMKPLACNEFLSKEMKK